MQRRTSIGTLALVAAACGGAPVDSAPSVSTADPQAEQTEFCDAFAVVTRKCVRCHSDPPVNGAPFALDSYAAIETPSPTRAEPNRIRADRMRAAVEANRMPDTELTLDPPVETLTCEERTTLLEWLRDGAKAPADGDTACAHAVPMLSSCDQTL